MNRSKEQIQEVIDDLRSQQADLVRQARQAINVAKDELYNIESQVRRIEDDIDFELISRIENVDPAPIFALMHVARDLKKFEAMWRDAS